MTVLIELQSELFYLKFKTCVMLFLMLVIKHNLLEAGQHIRLYVRNSIYVRNKLSLLSPVLDHKIEKQRGIN